MHSCLFSSFWSSSFSFLHFQFEERLLLLLTNNLLTRVLHKVEVWASHKVDPHKIVSNSSFLSNNILHAPSEKKLLKSRKEKKHLDQKEKLMLACRFVLWRERLKQHQRCWNIVILLSRGTFSDCRSCFLFSKIVKCQPNKILILQNKTKLTLMKNLTVLWQVFSFFLSQTDFVETIQWITWEINLKFENQTSNQNLVFAFGLCSLIKPDWWSRTSADVSREFSSCRCFALWKQWNICFTNLSSQIDL